MTFDLDEARRLHDRDDSFPDQCRSCDGPAGERAHWPCPTAIALGATGRPEWLNAPPPDPDTATRCTSRGGDPEGQCLHTTGHPGMHTTQLGDLWNDDTDGCPSHAPGGLQCQDTEGHQGRHWNTKTANRWLDPGQVPCDNQRPGKFNCDLIDGHNGPHRAWTGDTW